MSIKNYNNSIFYQFLGVNDFTLENLAYNLYYKIKNRGIMPESIVRSREEGVDLIASNENENVDIDIDKDFVFVNCLLLSVVGSELSLSGSDNIQKNYTIQFEFKPVAATFQFNLFGNLIEVSNAGIQVPNATFYSKVFGLQKYKVKIQRARTSLNVYINDELLHQQTLSLDNDFVVSGYLVKLISGEVKVGNIKITSSDFILHWWKLNNNGIEEDNALLVNSEDVLSSDSNTIQHS